ncbi:MAG: hypothetical protein CR966_01405 [Pseudomonadales bacterium]|nr:MAG: hypothetical protein CR966_01405 [Pseudomonadales bacterium]
MANSLSNHPDNQTANPMPTINPIPTNSTAETEPQAFELAELILDNNQPWKVHNCKLLKRECSHQGTLPFIYHYDKLADHLKHEHPLKGQLLANFNATDSITNPKFVKITGAIVIYHEPLQLAVRLHWSNTSKSADEIYCDTDAEAIKLSMENWLFIGRIDTLYKQNKPKLLVYDDEWQDFSNNGVGATSDTKNAENVATESTTDNKTAHGQYMLANSDGYQPMPHNFSVSLIAQLHDNQYVQESLDDKLDSKLDNKLENNNKLAWIDKVIKERVL